jgi:hypothetical protein
VVADRFRPYFYDYGMDLEGWCIDYRSAMGDSMLNGQASDSKAGGCDYDYQVNKHLTAQGSNLPLHVLSVEPDNVMLVSYDFGNNHIFHSYSEKVETNKAVTQCLSRKASL